MRKYIEEIVCDRCGMSAKTKVGGWCGTSVRIYPGGEPVDLDLCFSCCIGFVERHVALFCQPAIIDTSRNTTLGEIEEQSTSSKLFLQWVKSSKPKRED